MQISLQMIEESTKFLREKGIESPFVGIILGTGLSALASKIEVQISIPYHEIPHFPESTVEFHKGQLLFGKLNAKPVLAMQGRFHYYEGYSMQQITFPIRVMKQLGVQYLFLSNAAGGMNLAYKKGDLVLITDHINCLPDNPLRGLNDPSFGNRFVDMSSPYNEKLNTLLQGTAANLSISLSQGVYVSVMGPNLETKAEYKYLRSLGADMVGMSTVPEVIVANHIGLPCAAISVITDECDPENLQPVNIEEIIAVAGKADGVLSNLFAETISALPV